MAASVAAGFTMMGLGSEFFGLLLFGTMMPLGMVLSCIAALSIMPVLVLGRGRRSSLGRMCVKPRTSSQEPR